MSVGSMRSAQRSSIASYLGSASAFFFRELAHLAMGHLLVGAHQQRAAVGERGERRWAAGEELEAELVELELLDDLGAKEAVDVGCGRDLVAWPDLFGDAGASDHFASFADEDALAGAREVGSADERVVTSADEHDVVALRHDCIQLKRTGWHFGRHGKIDVPGAFRQPRVRYVRATCRPFPISSRTPRSRTCRRPRARRPRLPRDPPIYRARSSPPPSASRSALRR